jgi:hypothetical protein
MLEQGFNPEQALTLTAAYQQAIVAAPASAD